MDDLPDDAVLVARIEIVRYLTMSQGSHTDITVMEDHDNEGDQLSLIECLGLLRLAEDTAIQTRLNRDSEEEE